MANANAVKIRSTKKKANGKPKYPKPSGANLAHNSAVNKATYWLNDGNKIIQSQSYNNTHEVNADWIKWENEARERYKNNPNNQRAIKSNAVLLEEGLIIIGTDVNAKEKDIEKIVKDFVAKFEKDNNTKVRHWAYHNHEGHEEDGKEIINRHIHFIFDNVNNNGVMVRRNWKRDYFKQMQTDIFDISKKYIKNIERAKESEYEEVEIEDRIVKVNTRKQIHHRVFRQMKENEQIADLKNENTTLKKENSTLKGQNTKLKNANEALKIDKKELENQIKDLSKNLRETLKELEASRPQYAQLDQLNKELREELKNKVLDHEKVVKSYQDLEKNLLEELTKKDEKIDTLEVENKDLKSELEALKYQLDLKEKRSQSYFGLNKELKEEIVSLKEQINTLEAQNDTLTDKVIDLEDKIDLNANMNEKEKDMNVKEIKKELENEFGTNLEDLKKSDDYEKKSKFLDKFVENYDESTKKTNLLDKFAEVDNKQQELETPEVKKRNYGKSR